MKIKKLLLGVTFMLALTTVVLIDQNKAEAQGSGSSINCNVIVISNSDASIDKTSTEECGRCTVWVIRSGWKPENGIGAKYETREDVANGTVITCKSSASGSCNSTVLNPTVECPPMPQDLADHNNGTGTSNATGTGTSH